VVVGDQDALELGRTQENLAPGEPRVRSAAAGL
jgi:hypothetical protein